MASEEAGAPKKHKEMVLSAGYDDVTRTLVYSGRPMSVMKTPYLVEWSVFIGPSFPHLRNYLISMARRDTKRRQELDNLVAAGKIPNDVDMEKHPEKSVTSRVCRYSLATCSSVFLDENN